MLLCFEVVEWTETSLERPVTEQLSSSAFRPALNTLMFFESVCLLLHICLLLLARVPRQRRRQAGGVDREGRQLPPSPLAALHPEPKKVSPPMYFCCLCICLFDCSTQFASQTCAQDCVMCCVTWKLWINTSKHQEDSSFSPFVFSEPAWTKRLIYFRICLGSVFRIETIKCRWRRCTVVNTYVVFYVSCRVAVTCPCPPLPALFGHYLSSFAPLF